MDVMAWATDDPLVWRARSPHGDYLIRYDAARDTWTLVTPGRTWHALPDLEVAKEVAALADQVRADDDRKTLYRVVTVAGSVRGDEFGAESDDAAMDVVRERRRAGNLPLAPFRLETCDGRTVGSWGRASEVPSPS